MLAWQAGLMTNKGIFENFFLLRMEMPPRPAAPVATDSQASLHHVAASGATAWSYFAMQPHRPKSFFRPAEVFRQIRD